LTETLFSCENRKIESSPNKERCGMDGVEVNVIQQGSVVSGFDMEGVVVEYASAGASRRQRFLATHLIDTLSAAGLDALEISPSIGQRSRLFVTRDSELVTGRQVYDVLCEAEGVQWLLDIPF
jgi:hypothetical protein